MKRRLLSIILTTCLIVSLVGPLAPAAEAYSLSAWIPASSLPAGATPVDEKWIYTKTTYQDSTATSLSGYTLISSEWIKSGSGSREYATFPAGFDTKNSIYKNTAKSAYGSYETATTKQTVSNSQTGYIYWHWAYNVNYHNVTQRMISSRYGLGYYVCQYFDAFKSSVDCPKLSDSDTYNYASSKYNYSNVKDSLQTYNCHGYMPSTSGLGKATPRYFRFNYYTSTYTEYYKLFHYQKVEQLESPSYPSGSGISNATKYVRYKSAFTITFDANGGSGGPGSQTKSFSSPMTISSVEPSKAGYMFLGWSANRNATSPTYYPGSSYSGDDDATLYAVWGTPRGTCGQNVSWSYDISQKELSIQGFGELGFSSSSAVPWARYASDIEKITVADGITYLGDFCFYGCRAATSIRLPANLITIGTAAFQGCYSLQSLGIPSGVRTIRPSAFYGCGSLRKMVLPDSLTELGGYAFAGCSSLGSVNIPRDITELRTNLFQGCSSLTEITVPDNIISIEDSAFANCPSLASVTVPNSVTLLGNNVFSGDVNLNLRCYVDSAAYQYAQGNGISVTPLSYDQLAEPSFSLTDLYGRFFLSMSSPDNAEIRYTLDGSDPVTGGSVCSAAIEIPAGGAAELRACCVKLGYQTSDILSATVIGQSVDMPVAEIASGSRISVTTEIGFSCDTPGAELWYSTNGYEPDEGNPDRHLYTGPFVLNRPGQSVTVCVKAYRYGYAASQNQRVIYHVAEDIAVPTVTYQPQDIGTNSATLSAWFESKESVEQVEICWYETNNSNGRKWSISLTPSGSSVDQEIRGLDPGTDYCYYINAKNAVGWGTGGIGTFSTQNSDYAQPWILLDEKSIELRVGRSRTLLATVLPASAQSWVYWTSSDPDVVSVDDSGTVTAGKYPGQTATITARLRNGAMAQCTVKVLTGDANSEDPWDFSEKHMIMSCSNANQQHGMDLSPNTGGYALMAAAYLARWDGAVEEANDPFPEVPSVFDLTYNSAVDTNQNLHVQSVYFLPARTDSLDNDQIKAAIMNYGAVYTSFYEDPSYYSGNNYYYPARGSAYGSGDNHAVAIVGWDDNHSNFVYGGNFPRGRGAFICKNSRGADQYDKGYFYVSYYDANLARGNDYNAVFCNLQNNDNYNKIYQYDYLGPTQLYQVRSDKVYLANVFPEQGSALTEDELLKAVSFYNYTPGTNYCVYVVPNYSGPESLQTLGKPAKVGTQKYTGYDTVELDESVYLRQGTRYAVVLELSNESGVFLEAPDPINGYSRVTAGADESYLRQGTGRWTDVTRLVSDANVCIKAFTATPNYRGTLFGTENPSTMDLWYDWGEEDDSAQLFAGRYSTGLLEPSLIPQLPSNDHSADGARLPSSFDLRRNHCVSPVENQGTVNGCWSFAAYASLESAALLKGLNNSGSNLSQSAGRVREIGLDHNSATLAVGDHLQLLATLYPLGSDETIFWESDNSAISVSARGFMTAEHTGVATVTARTADGSARASCDVTVLMPEPARYIQLTDAAPTIQPGEAALMSYLIGPANADKSRVTWTSSDSSIAEIDQYGYVRGIGYGYVTLTVSAGNGVSDSCTLFVDDGRSFSADVVQNGLNLSNGRAQGSMTLNLQNLTGASANATVYLAFYSESGRFLQSYSLSRTLSPGAQQAQFTGINVSYPAGEDVRYKIFLLDDRTRTPLAPATEGTLT